MSGNTTTTYLDPLNFGTSAETTSTLGQDPADIRIPPDQNHISALQIARIKNLVLSMSQDSGGGNRVKIRTQASNQFAVGEYGVYVTTSGLQVVLNGGTPGVVVTGGPSIKQSPVFSATPAFNPNLGSVIAMTLTNNLGTWGTMSAGSDGQQWELNLTQDGTGSRTIGTPPSNIVWLATTYLGATHSVPTLTTTINKTDIFYFRYNTGLSKWVEYARAMAVS
jgi:hypothetical protein